MQRGWGVVVAALLGAVIVPVPASAVDCPTEIADHDFVDEAGLRAMNQVMADAGPRPTASPAHEGYIRWIEEQLTAIPGLELRTMPYTIDRWLERGASLRLVSPGGTQVRVAGAVPYSKPATVRGPVVHVPGGTAIGATDVRGKVVVRDRPIFGSQQAIFLAVSDYVHDPDASIDYAGSYERDVSAYQGILTDLAEATAGGAAGLVFAATVPHEQAFSYAPYAGQHFGIPAVQVGVDEGEALKAASGRNVELTVKATRTPGAPTRNVIARLQGQSDQRIAIASHTDGMNAVWDNGPTAILALARYFASLPLECRPRTLEFAFTTAHLYQSDVGAHRYAAELDEGYDEGTVALAIALEHLGAREYLTKPRGDGPGVELEATGRSEMFVTFSNESPVTKAALISRIVARDLRRTWALRGADAPYTDGELPPHRSYGGEGGVYHQALIPTIAGITGPNTLFKPTFSLDELLDVSLMRRQAMAFGDIVLTLDDVPRELIAGADTAYREARASVLPLLPPIPPPPSTTATAAAPPPFFCDIGAMVERSYSSFQ